VDNIGKYLKIHKEKNEFCEMQALTNEPRYENKGILNVMASMILKAKKSVKLVTPYFAPTELCEGALFISARSGINVQIIVPGKSDNKNITLVTNRSYYERLLSQNCKVYEYDGFIHSKYLIIDDKIALVTSSNFDFRSF
jgi:cardiolipin synthase